MKTHAAMPTRSRLHRALLGAAGGLLLTLSAAAFAQDVTPLAPGQFEWTPEVSTTGPLLVVVSIPEQMAYVYRGGQRIGRSTISSGRPGHETPTGVFEVMEKDRNHHSNKYNNAPMPFMQRLTWDGVALHAGQIPGYPASHGCVRLPKDFAEDLYEASERGVKVVIADETTNGPSVLHPGDAAPVDSYTGLEPGRSIDSVASTANTSNTTDETDRSVATTSAGIGAIAGN